jgi:hypothetical protein
MANRWKPRESYFSAMGRPQALFSRRWNWWQRKICRTHHTCGGDQKAYFCLVEPTKEFGMHDYRLDEVEKPERHPDAVKRLTEPPRRTVSSTGGELPGRKMDGRR